VHQLQQQQQVNETLLLLWLLPGQQLRKLSVAALRKQQWRLLRGL
jgi:hypothetical protein